MLKGLPARQSYWVEPVVQYLSKSSSSVGQLTKKDRLYEPVFLFRLHDSRCPLPAARCTLCAVRCAHPRLRKQVSRISFPSDEGASKGEGGPSASPTSI